MMGKGKLYFHHKRRNEYQYSQFLLSWEINSWFSKKMKKKYSLHTTISQHKNNMFIVLKNRHRLSISIIST